MCYNIYSKTNNNPEPKEMFTMTTRKEFYEMLVENLTHDEFVNALGCEPADIQAFEYDFDTDVTWNMNLEYAYNAYIDN